MASFKFKLSFARRRKTTHRTLRFKTPTVEEQTAFNSSLSELAWTTFDSHVECMKKAAQCLTE
eukprot:4283926-Amphidinium_carterae.1